MASGGHQDRARLAIPAGLGSSDPSVAEQVTLTTSEVARPSGFTYLSPVCPKPASLSKSIAQGRGAEFHSKAGPKMIAKVRQYIAVLLQIPSR